MELVTYRKYGTEEEAIELIELLKSNNIECFVENIVPSVDMTFTGGNELEDKVAVKLKPKDFEKVEDLLSKVATENVDLIDRDHYLYDFTDEELFEVLENFNEWSKTDFLLAQRILKERGKYIAEEQIEELKNKKIAELRMPEKGHRGWLIAGYIFAILGGLLALFIGYHHYKFKKSLPTGERVYAYDAKTRGTGLRIFYIGLISIVFWITIRLFGF